MTVQSAINTIRYRIETASEIAGKGADGKAFEDLEMAIEALEKQITLERVIERLEEKAKEYTNDDLSYRIPWFGIDEAIEIIKEELM